MRTVRHPCGCRSAVDRELWVELCPPCAAQWRTLHDRAAADRRPAPAPVAPTAAYACATCHDAAVDCPVCGGAL